MLAVYWRYYEENHYFWDVGNTTFTVLENIGKYMDITMMT